MNFSDVHIQHKRLKIAFLTVNDPKDKTSWSGTTYSIGRSLDEYVGDVDFLGPVIQPWLLDKTLRAISKLTRIISKKEYNPKYGIIGGKYAAKVLKSRMKQAHYDIVVAPAASTELAYFETDVPVIYISDTTYNLISNYYKKEFKNVSSLSKWEGNILEKRSLQKSTAIIVSSQWAADSAIKDYGVDADKIYVMPFGANIGHTPSKDQIFIKESNKTLTLLFLAVDWERKGGAIAFDTMKQLSATGIDVKLIVCGCIPPSEFVHPNMEVISFLDKNIPAHQAKFLQLLTDSHFLILPTRADCSLLVGCEANAFGMPVITTDTGGVSGVVKDSVNGYCLPFNANATIYSTLISSIFADKERYHSLIITSRKRFEERLNWEVWAEDFYKFYESKILKLQPSNINSESILPVEMTTVL